jgi:Tol biopolymer transport system component
VGSSANATADGKRLAFVRSSPHMTSYVAELAAGATRMVNLRHFPLTESSDGVTDWTADSKEVINVSNRAGDYWIYRQDLDEEAAEPVVTEGYGRNPRVTPDGKWILYLGLGDVGQPLERRPQPVMRVPIDGGASQSLFISRPWSIITCGRSPSKLCAIAEPSDDRKQLIVTALDAWKGRGAELTRFELDPTDNRWFLDLSADGTRLAITRSPAGPLYILSVSGQLIRQIIVKGWSNLLEFTWAADGKGLFVVSGLPGRHVLLYVDLQGNAHPLWESPGASGETIAKPSPDGRHLAIQTWTMSSNMWLMQNF